MNIKQIMFLLACVTCISNYSFAEYGGPDDDVAEMQESLELGNDSHFSSGISAKARFEIIGLLQKEGLDAEAANNVLNNILRNLEDPQIVIIQEIVGAALGKSAADRLSGEIYNRITQ